MKEWTDRLAAMVRIEALLLGGAAEWDSFPALLKKLRGPLTTQVGDRRRLFAHSVPVDIRLLFIFVFLLLLHSTSV